MSSDLFVHGDSSSSSSLLRCSPPDLVFPSDAELQIFSDPYSPNFADSIDFVPALPTQLAADESNSNNSNSGDHFIPMQGLTLSQNNDFNSFQNNFSVKTEESHLGFASNSFNQQPPLCFDPSENNNDIAAADKSSSASLLLRSFSEKPGFLGFQSRLQSLLMDSPNFPHPDSDFFSSQVRRVFSTGDLQNSGIGRSGSGSGSGSGQGSFSSPLSENGSGLEEGNFKVGRYSAEERKERISKYRAKRTQRNFNKTIKYACRKTLADNRPRIRGRFARNDEPGEIPKAACSTREEDEDDFWMEGLHAGGEEEGTMRGKQYNEMYGRMQLQYCGF